MKKQINVMVNGKCVGSVYGQTLSEIINGERPCGGHGSCGKCRVVAKGDISAPSKAELELLSSDELEKGVRLACLTKALGDCEIYTLPDSGKAQIATSARLLNIDIKPSFKKYGVAVDIGTTTLAARLYDTSGNMLSEQSCLNPQISFGADVISRIEAALDGKSEQLATAIRKNLNDIMMELAVSANIKSNEIDRVVITGNTVMLSLLTRESVLAFSRAPFDVQRLFGETLCASELELDCLAPSVKIYLPPCISAFVGADTVCAVIATGLCDTEAAMLADIGTNGEMALWYGGTLSVCSTAAGPAFEGVGIFMGMRGAEGAIDKVSIVNGRLSAHVIGDTAPIGICGSGLVDAAACMLDLEMLDESGHLDGEEVTISDPVTLTQKDIRMLQLAKSAVCAGLVTLMSNKNLSFDGASTLYIAGGFGSYLNKHSASRIGLLPVELARRVDVVGNAALGGACMLLLNSELCEAAVRLARNAELIDLATSNIFADNFMSGMLLGEI